MTKTLAWSLRYPGGSTGKESVCNAGDQWVQSLCQEDPLEKGMLFTPVFLPGEFHRQRSLAVHGVAELDMTEWLTLSI